MDRAARAGERAWGARMNSLEHVVKPALDIRLRRHESLPLAVHAEVAD